MCKYFHLKIVIISLSISQNLYVLGAQKKHLFETVLLSIHNIGFDCEIRKLFINNLLIEGLFYFCFSTSPYVVGT